MGKKDRHATVGWPEFITIWNSSDSVEGVLEKFGMPDNRDRRQWANQKARTARSNGVPLADWNTKSVDWPRLREMAEDQLARIEMGESPERTDDNEETKKEDAP